MANATNEELKKFIVDAAKQDESVASMVVARFANASSSAELKRIEAEFEQIITGNSDRYGFINYKASYRFEREFDEYLRKIVVQLISANKIWLAFEVLQSVILQLGYLEIDDSNGTISCIH